MSAMDRAVHFQAIPLSFKWFLQATTTHTAAPASTPGSAPASREGFRREVCAGGRRVGREAAGNGSRASNLGPMSVTGGARRRQIGRPAAGDGSVSQRGGSPPPRAARGAPLCCPAGGDIGPMSGAGGARRRQIGRGRCERRIGCALEGVHADGSRIAFTDTCKCRRWCSC
jgi:hypothetical protein